MLSLRLRGRRGFAVALTLTVALTAPAFADPASKARVLAALQGASAGSEPLFTFFRALVALPNFTLEGPEMRDVLKQTGLNTGPAAPVLKNVKRIVKQGEDVTITNIGEAESDIVINGVKKGSVRVQPTITATVKNGGLTDIEGIEGNTPSSPWVDVKKIAFATEDGKPVAKMTVKWGLFSKTITMPIKSLPPAGSPSSGITASVPH